MAEEKFNAYTQSLYDTVLSLRVEIDNLRKAYSTVHQRIDEIATLSDKSSSDAVKDAINVEELARLALVASTVAHSAASLVDDATILSATHKTVLSADEAYKTAASSTLASKARQTSGGYLKSEGG